MTGADQGTTIHRSSACIMYNTIRIINTCILYYYLIRLGGGFTRNYYTRSKSLHVHPLYAISITKFALAGPSDAAGPSKLALAQKV